MNIDKMRMALNLLRRDYLIIYDKFDRYNMEMPHILKEIDKQVITPFEDLFTDEDLNQIPSSLSMETAIHQARHYVENRSSRSGRSKLEFLYNTSIDMNAWVRVSIALTPNILISKMDILDSKIKEIALDISEFRVIVPSIKDSVRQLLQSAKELVLDTEYLVNNPSWIMVDYDKKLYVNKELEQMIGILERIPIRIITELSMTRKTRSRSRSRSNNRKRYS